MTANQTEPKRTLRFKDGILVITDNGKADVYHVRELKCQLGGRAFRVVKQDGSAGYDVRVDGYNSSCECLGCLRWNRCRHVDALAVLIGRGQL